MPSLVDMPPIQNNYLRCLRLVCLPPFSILYELCREFDLDIVLDVLDIVLDRELCRDLDRELDIVLDRDLDRDLDLGECNSSVGFLESSNILANILTY